MAAEPTPAGQRSPAPATAPFMPEAGDPQTAAALAALSAAFMAAQNAAAAEGLRMCPFLKKPIWVAVTSEASLMDS
jgi:hypothetical protein